MSDFSRRLIEWQRHHGRHDLPWQGGKDPYRVWLSEIMLQQTQVGTVIPYYERFVARFPDVAALAAAPVDEVMALWSGLGYYARARNLHRAAQQVMSAHGGCFPRAAHALLTLPGVGRSTAAAIAAFCSDERAAILDGNVKRVLCRVFGVDGFPGEKAVDNRLWALAESLLPATGVGTYIQAQMDLGATVCTRTKPACARCPLAEACIARLTGRIAELPTPRPRKAVPRRSVEVAVIVSRGAVLLERRPPSGIWGGLLALPEVPAPPATIATTTAITPPITPAAIAADAVARIGAWTATALGMSGAPARPLPALTHTFTHFVLELQPWLIEVAAPPAAVEDGTRVWLDLGDTDGAALPTPVRRILEQLAQDTLRA